MPAETAVPRPVALSASRMRMRLKPVAERSRPSGLRPPPPPRNVFSEAASWTAWIALISVTELPNRMRATTSSCGRLGEEVKAVVQASPGYVPGRALADELIAYCRARLSPIKCPRSIDFRAELPRTPTGKLLKRLLRDEYWPQKKAEARGY